MSPFLIFWFLIVGATIVAIIAPFRPRFVEATAVGLVGLAWLGWLLLGRNLPLLLTSAGGAFFTYRWQLDDVSWQLSGVWLLLATAVLVAGWQSGKVPGNSATTQLRNTASFILILTAVGFLPLWADSLVSLLLSSTLMIGSWSGVLWLVVNEVRQDPNRLLPRAIWLMLSLLFLWLASAVAPDHGNAGLQMGVWPTVATSSVLTAALLQMGTWPFHGWRSLSWSFPPGLNAMIYTLPALSGIYLLSRLVASSDVSIGYSLFLTAFGLLGLLRGVRLAWSSQTPAQSSASLASGQINLGMLALTWVGAGFVVAEGRVLLLALGIIFLTTRPINRSQWWHMIPPLVSLAALAGLPLTAGLPGRAGLYAVWLDESRLVLMVVAGLLHVPLVTAVLWHFFGQRRADENENGDENGPQIAPIIAGLLLAVGLLGTKGLVTGTMGGWLALLLPFGAGGLLYFFMGKAGDWQPVVRQAFTLNLPLAATKTRLRLLSTYLGTAVRGAATIWEGEGGLLWLLALLVILLVAQ